MRKLIFIIVLFFSTSVFSQGKWDPLPGTNLSTLINEGWKIIDQYSTAKDVRYYLLQNNKVKNLIICSTRLTPIKGTTNCLVEMVHKNK
jgi:hypothetical protein